MLIYIIGRGKSGSTILDIALSQSDNVVGMGELISGLGSNKTCTCGKKAKDCSEWKDLYSGKFAVSKQKMDYLKSESNVKYFFKYFILPKFYFKKASKKYLIINSLIIQAKKKGRQNSIFIDSSKEITRGLLLLRGTEDTVLIHLIRDPYKVLSSNMSRVEDGSGFKFMRKNYNNRSFRPIYFIITAVSWVVGNILCEFTKLYSKNRSIRVRFEDLCFESNHTIGEIEKLTYSDLSKSKLFLEGQIFSEQTHQMGGNRTNRKKNQYFDKNRASGRENLSNIEKKIALLITGILRKLYGY
jgi:hypothetical protein